VSKVEFELHIEKSVLDLLYGYAEEELPNEAVALLFGKYSEMAVDVTRAELVTNMESSRTRFSIDPSKHYELLIDAEQRGEELVCIFHSHPTNPLPSNLDVTFMELNPVPWLIASRAEGTWQSKSYLLKEGEPLEIRTILV
jgi:proteasome lid subunit RPN8/RPN11